MSVVTATILSDGRPVDPKYELMSVDVSKEVNRIPRASVVFLDGSAAQQRFAISDSGVFDPGKEVEIRLRYEGGVDVSVFRGVIVSQRVEAGGVASSVVVELKDAAIKLTRLRRRAVFRQQTDQQIIDKIVGDAGLRKGKMETTQPKHAEIVQYDATDWDFILTRADVQGMVVVADDGQVSLRKVVGAGRPKHHFEYGISEIYNFEMEVDAGHQIGSIESVAWDSKQQRPTPAHKAKPFALSQGGLEGSRLAKAIGFDTCTLSHPTALASEELQAWADARMARSRLAMLRGRLAVPGFADIKPLDVMEVAGIGKGFNGMTLVTGIRHRVTTDGWQTDVQFGLSPKPFCLEDNIQDAPAAGLLPAVGGLHIGVVDKFEADPDNELRVKVILPAIDAKTGAVWARLALPDAGKDRGMYFRPEPGDEVVVGFFNDDPRQPVILGAMYGSKNTAPKAGGKPSEQNLTKAIVTKGGTTIGFIDDDKASMYLETKNKNRLLFDDQTESIKITDQHGNSITLDKDGITIKSAQDIKCEAGGNVEIKGTKVDVK